MDSGEMGKRIRDLEKELEVQKTLNNDLVHRVKNHFQLAIALAEQLRRNHDHPLTQQALKKVKQQLLSLATLHQTLSEAESLDTVSSRRFFTQLTNQLASTFEEVDSSFTLRKDVADRPLSTREAVYCGLVLAELVTNAFQHGIENGCGDKISIQFKPSNGQYELRVSNNGSTLDSSLDQLAEESHGLKLVQKLANGALKGSVYQDDREEACVVVRFLRTASEGRQ